MPQQIAIANITPAHAEASRVLTICNACRYCEGYCPVFPAITRRTKFDAANLDYLANLCHNCTACYHACQYKPPHEFNVNVPEVLANVRIDSYEKYAWPQSIASAFAHNGLVLSLVTAVTLALVLGLALSLTNADVLFAQNTAAGAFYTVISHGLMNLVAGGTFGFSLLALWLGGVRYWRQMNLSWREFFSPANLIHAFKAAATLQHLGGGHGQGCNTADESFSNQRLYYHQLTMWGFLLCFAATCVATVYEYAFSWMSPFPLFSVPVMLGTAGGIGLLVGPVGLFWLKLRSDPTPKSLRSYGMDYAFLMLLFSISLTGLALLGLRETSAMGMLLVIHLGFVLALFIVLPYSKFVHSIYRFAALVQSAHESNSRP